MISQNISTHLADADQNGCHIYKGGLDILQLPTRLTAVDFYELKKIIQQTLKIVAKKNIVQLPKENFFLNSLVAKSF